ncbi:hypothetical protein [Pseudomonas sp. Pdm06]|uniref:hypothetical protein n=1 Tax=Pseudomonas sp. Pdm06 TaxID=1790044 RepID=UPI001CE03168|nr:hypothetical protein [Pseudomonas sp. Pdm06]
MKFEGTFQYMGNHGIVFNVSQVTLDSNGMPDLPRAVLHQKADEIDKQIRECRSVTRSDMSPSARAFAYGMPHLQTAHGGRGKGDAREEEFHEQATVGFGDYIRTLSEISGRMAMGSALIST